MQKSGTIYRRPNGNYCVEYFDPITQKKKMRVLYKVIEGRQIAITKHDEAQKAAAQYLSDVQQIQKLQSRAAYAAEVAATKKLIVSITLKLSDVWPIYQKSPKRRELAPNTLKYYKTIWSVFLKFMQHQYPDCQKVAELSPAIAEKYFAALWDTGVAERTYNAHLQALSMLVSFVGGKDFDNPFADICSKPLDTQRRAAFSVKQLASIFPLLDDNSSIHLMYKNEMRVMIYGCFYAGARMEDVVFCLRKSAITYNETVQGNMWSYIPVKTKAKVSTLRSVPIHQVWQAQIDTLPPAVDDNLLPNLQNRYRRNPDGIYKDVIKLIEAAGIKTSIAPPPGVRRKQYKAADGSIKTRKISVYSGHSLRHSGISQYAETGKPLGVIGDMVGHSSVEMTQHYVHGYDDMKGKIVAALPAIGSTGVSASSNRIMAFLQSCSPSDIALLKELLKNWA